MLNQAEQDRLWSHFQTDGRSAFDLSYPRLRFLAEKCPAGTRVLNIGVGNGYLEALLIGRGVETFSLDPSEESVQRLRGDLKMGSRAQCGHSQSIPFDDRSFDKVIMTEVLEHLPADIMLATFDQVRRVLRPNGEFTGTVPYREDLAANEVMCPQCQLQFHRWGHAQRFDVTSLGEALKGHGFLVERLYPRAFPDFRRRGAGLFLKATFRYLLGRLGEPLVGPNLYFVARRPHADVRSADRR